MGQTGSLIRKVGSYLYPKSEGELCKDLAVPKFGATPFVYKRRGSMYMDEDGDLAHEFYEEVKDKNTNKTHMEKLEKNLVPQGEVDLPKPAINGDMPIVLCEAWTLR